MNVNIRNCVESGGRKMQREIKFRAWDKEMKYMRLLDDVHDTFMFSEDGSAEYYNLQNGSGGDEYVLMQYTGLKDKNGKEIYEGDIVEIVYYNSKYMGKVVFNEKTCGFEIWHNSIVGVYGEKATHKINFAMDIEIKVIGNIYENSEPLQEESHE